MILWEKHSSPTKLQRHSCLLLVPILQGEWGQANGGMPGQYPEADALEVLPHHTLIDCSTLNMVPVLAWILAFQYVR